MLAILQHLVAILAVLVSMLHQAVTTLPASTIREYFLHLHVSSVALLLCSQQGDERWLLRELSDFSLVFSPDAVSDQPLYRTGGVLDLACPFAQPVISKLSKKRSFGVHTEWLFLDYVNSTDKFEKTEGVDKLRSAYLLPSSRVTLAQTDGQEVVYLDLFRVSLARPLQAHFLSRQPVHSFQPLPPRSMKRLDFNGITLTSAAVLYHLELFKGFNSYEHPEVDTIPKVNFPIVETLSEQLNFRYPYHFNPVQPLLDRDRPARTEFCNWLINKKDDEPRILRKILWTDEATFTSNTILILDDYGWQTNMTFSGLVGMLQREEIDLGATGIFMRPDRILTIDFIGDTFEIKSKLIFRQPSLSSVSNIFVLPFTLMVWVCCVALALLTAILLVLDAKVTIGQRQAFTEPVTPSDICTTIIGCICQQGAWIVPKSGSAKTTLFLFSLCTLFFYTSYSANIVALLQSTSPTIHTLADLTASPLAVGAQDVIYNRIYFQEAVDERVKELYRKKVLPHGKRAYLDPEEGIRKVRSGLFAFTVESHWGYKIISDTFLESEKCGIDEIKLFLLPKMSIPVIKKSGYRETFTVMNTLQRDVGLHSRVKRRWLLGKPDCDSHGRGFVSVGLMDFKPALQVMGYGYLATSLVFFAELLLHYRKKLLSGIINDKTSQAWQRDDYNIQINKTAE